MGLQGLWAFILRSPSSLLQRCPDSLPSSRHILVDVPNVGRLKDGVDLLDLLKKLENPEATVLLAVDFGGNFSPLTRTATLVASRAKSMFKEITVIGSSVAGTADDKIAKRLHEISPESFASASTKGTRSKASDPSVLVVSADTDLLFSLSLSPLAPNSALVVPPNASVMLSSEPFGRSAPPRLLRTNAFCSFIESGAAYSPPSASRAVFRFEFAFLATLVGRAEVATESAVVVAMLNAFLKQCIRQLDSNRTLRADRQTKGMFLNIEGDRIVISNPAALSRFIAPFAREGAAAFDALGKAALGGAAHCVTQTLREISQMLAPLDASAIRDVKPPKISSQISLPAISQWLAQATEGIEGPQLPAQLAELTQGWSSGAACSPRSSGVDSGRLSDVASSTVLGAGQRESSHERSKAEGALSRASSVKSDRGSSTPVALETPKSGKKVARGAARDAEPTTPENSDYDDVSPSLPRTMERPPRLASPLAGIEARTGATRRRFADEIMSLTATSNGSAGDALRTSATRVFETVAAAQNEKVGRHILNAAVRSMKRKGKGKTSAAPPPAEKAEEAVEETAGVMSPEPLNLWGVDTVVKDVVNFEDSDDDGGAPPRKADGKAEAGSAKALTKSAKRRLAAKRRKETFEAQNPTPPTVDEAEKKGSRVNDAAKPSKAPKAGKGKKRGSVVAPEATATPTISAPIGAAKKAKGRVRVPLAPLDNGVEPPQEGPSKGGADKRARTSGKRATSSTPPAKRSSDVSPSAKLSDEQLRQELLSIIRG